MAGRQVDKRNNIPNVAKDVRIGKSRSRDSRGLLLLPAASRNSPYIRISKAHSQESIEDLWHRRVVETYTNFLHELLLLPIQFPTQETHLSQDCG